MQHGRCESIEAVRSAGLKEYMKCIPERRKSVGLKYAEDISEQYEVLVYDLWQINNNATLKILEE